MSNQRTLDQHFKMPPMKPRQFQAVTVKNWTLLAQSPFGMIGCFIVSVLFVVLVGWLHTFYEHQYKPIDNNSSEMIPNPMPIESQPENINHHMHFTLTTNVSADTVKFFGTLPENAQGTGYIGAADRKWTANNEKAQLRAQYAIPENINCSITQSQIPFATIDDLSCTTDACKPKYTTFEQLDEAVNNTLYELMAQDIDAEHKQPTKKLSFTEKLLNAVENSFKVKKVQETEFTFTINDYNLTNQFKWDKHERLYTSAVNFSYLNFPINKLLAPKVHEVGYKYILSSYSSHQTQMSYSLSNFNHLGGTQYFLYQTFLRNTFEPQVGSEPASVKGYQKQFWELYQDQGADPFTPIFSTVLIPIAFYLLVTLFAYQMSQEKGDGLLSLQQMMGLRYYPRYLADLVYQLVIGMVMFGVIMGGCAISGMEFISHTYWGIWFLFGMLFVLNIPLLSQLLSSFTDSGRISSILSIFIILVEAVVGISWVSNMYDASVVDRTISMWYALIPGMAPIVAMAMVNGLIITQNPNNYLSESLYFKLSKVSDGSMTADVGYEVAWAIMLGFIALVVYAFLSIYIDRITPRRNGIPEHPLFFLQSLYERASVNARRIFVEITWASAFWAVGQMFVHPKILLISQAEIDQFVSEERHKSEQNEVDEDDVSQSGGTSSTTFDYLKGGKDNTTTGSELSHPSQSGNNNMQRKIQKEYKHQNKMSIRDPDLATEKQLTIQGLAASNGQIPLVRLLNLRKTYPATRYTPAKHAVRGVYYTVGENECLCLLGANGCGKTSQINMLCMLFKPTNGTAYICGKSINDRRSQQYIQTNLGVCPQFDILYPTMSIRQHLRFYARIKGVHKSIQEEHISDLLEAVELTKQQNQASKSLSGGMKRRLSISIALCSKPKVLIFDEPSSGLDVATRRQLWNVIIKARQGRAVLLTTHAMEEAECLSTRIAIMAEGKIRCIGTAAGLQKKFGSGYQLTICVDKEKIMKADPVYVGSVYLSSKGEQVAHQKIMKEIGQGLVLASCYQGSLVYIIPENVVISELFGKMEGLVKDLESGICDWGLNQTSLESVFMKVVSQSY
ncbi:ABC_transporter family protein [Hexamita inflata]|uniref:ABC transporter family protein n=1 Tax=Hexamita inflata TaxID=28002 RepID=A0AA86PCT6_9EUKA|nr:ABC transporter family protein [Hexamita inflata]